MTSWREELMQNKELEAFIKYMILRSKGTQKVYLARIKEICDHFEIKYSEFNPKNLTQKDYDQFLYDNIKKYKQSSLNLFSRVFNILSNIYGLNIKTQLLKETDKHTDYLRFSELQEIILKADKEVAAVAAFMFCTGLRPISVISITKDQLILNAKDPYIKNVYLKGGRRQDVVILYPDIVLPLLRWYMQYKSMKLKDYDKIPYVFVSQKGNVTDFYIRKLINRCEPIVGRKVSPRMLRKGLGVHTKELGLQDDVRRRIMTHADVKTTIDAYSDYSTRDVFRELRSKAYDTVQNVNSQQLRNSQGHDANHDVCPYCGKFVDPEMMYCPYCWKEIKRLCSGCKRFIQSDWKKCPYCGTEFGKKKKQDKALFWDYEKKEVID